MKNDKVLQNNDMQISCHLYTQNMMKQTAIGKTKNDSVVIYINQSHDQRKHIIQFQATTCNQDIPMHEEAVEVQILQYSQQGHKLNPENSIGFP